MNILKQSLAPCFVCTYSILALTLSSGCTSTLKTSSFSEAAQQDRHTNTAKQLNDAGLKLLEDEQFDQAEQKFREAIDQDLYYASPHNNLGLILMQKKEYYKAAWEFRTAAKLAPNTSEPRANLGLLYENIGRLDAAINTYEDALEIDSSNYAAMKHLARAYVKSKKHNDKLNDLLPQFKDLPIDKQWDYWVRGQIVRFGRKK